VAQFNHENKFLWKYKDETFNVSYNFTDDLATSEDISTVSASCYNSNGYDVTATILSNVAASSPDSARFTTTGGQEDTTYEIKLIGVGSSGSKYIHRITMEIYGYISLNANLADPSANSFVTLQEANKYIKNKRGRSNTWDSLSIEGKKRLLIEACKDISKFNFRKDKYYDNQSLPFPDSDHNIVTGNCATPLTLSGFKNSNLRSTSYGAARYNNNYWKYGTVHITSATPLNDIRYIKSSNGTNGTITVDTDFSATPTTNTQFIIFEPLHENIREAQIEQAMFILDNEGVESVYAYKSLGAQRVKIGDVEVAFKGNAGMDKSPLSSNAKKLLSRWIRTHIRIGRA